MKKIVGIIVIIVMVMSPDIIFANNIPTSAEYDEAASISSVDFSCGAVDPIQLKILQYEFIKKPATQQLMEICTYGSVAFILREEIVGAKRKVKGGTYVFGASSSTVERSGHLFSNTCEIQDTTQSTSTRLNYLCYNPAVAAGSTDGVEYSFRTAENKTYKRNCTVNFGGKNKCGKWKKLK